jgi:membrane-associated phospholipid phosphatase
MTMTALAWARPLQGLRRSQVTGVSAAMCAVIILLARAGETVVRDWAPALSILAGYWISGRFFVQPSARFESWLSAWDWRLLGDPTVRFVGWPRVLLVYLDVVYVGCFLLVPAGFAALESGGHASLGDRYWTLVVGAELGSFVSLGLVQARPPWLLERSAQRPDRTVHRFASTLVETFTTQANTFPSGHVAGSLAVALGLAGAMPSTAAVFFILALSISLACIVGRYHYVVDVVAGGALALAIWACNA